MFQFTFPRVFSHTTRNPVTSTWCQRPDPDMHGAVLSSCLRRGFGFRQAKEAGTYTGNYPQLFSRNNRTIANFILVPVFICISPNCFYTFRNKERSSETEGKICTVFYELPTPQALRLKASPSEQPVRNKLRLQGQDKPSIFFCPQHKHVSHTCHTQLLRKNWGGRYSHESRKATSVGTLLARAQSTAARDATAQLVEREQSPCHGSPPLSSQHLTTKSSGTSSEEHQAGPHVSSMIYNFRAEKWLGEPAQKLSLEGTHTTNRMASVTTALLRQRPFSLYCLLCFFREVSSLLNQSIPLIPLLLLWPSSQPTCIKAACPSSGFVGGFIHRVLCKPPVCEHRALCSSLLPLPLFYQSCQLWGWRSACCACPAQTAAQTLGCLHPSKLPHVFSISARTEESAQRIITTLKAKATSLQPLHLKQPFTLRG